MALPKIDLPLFELTIPSTNRRATYRPFTVKEEKILLIAQESKDPKQIVLAIKQILTNCVNNVDIDALAAFDLQYILLNIRAKSVNNEITFNIKDPETNETLELTIDANEIQVKKFPGHDKIVKLTEDIYLQMKYPTIEYLENISYEEEKNSDQLTTIMTECIDSVIEGEQVYKLKEFSKKEVTDFVESLTSDIVIKIKNFFDTMPVLRYEKKYVNSLGNEKTFVAEGLETFFI